MGKYIGFCFFFFFSSRRRHTRWNCDWSSDVCSSDLGLLGERLVRENANPQFSAALDEPRDGHARRFNLPVGDPRAFHGLQPVFAERQLSAAPRLALAAPAHLLPILHLFRHQHRSVLASSSRVGPTASGPTILSLLFALTPLLQFRVRSESSKRASERFRPDRPSTSRR